MEFNWIWWDLKILIYKWLLCIQCESAICKICSYSFFSIKNIKHVYFSKVFPSKEFQKIASFYDPQWSFPLLQLLAAVALGLARPWLKYDDKLCDFLLDFAFLQWCCHTLEGKVEWPILSASRFWISSF